MILTHLSSSSGQTSPQYQSQLNGVPHPGWVDTHRQQQRLNGDQPNTGIEFVHTTFTKNIYKNICLFTTGQVICHTRLHAISLKLNGSYLGSSTLLLMLQKYIAFPFLHKCQLITYEVSTFLKQQKHNNHNSNPLTLTDTILHGCWTSNVSNCTCFAIYQHTCTIHWLQW